MQAEMRAPPQRAPRRKKKTESDILDRGKMKDKDLRKKSRERLRRNKHLLKQGNAAHRTRQHAALLHRAEKDLFQSEKDAPRKDWIDHGGHDGDHSEEGEPAKGNGSGL